MQKKESASSQQSIERALKLLNMMGESKTPMNITEISKALGISRSTTYAMVNVMTEMNFLDKNYETGKYFLGYSNFILGSVSRLRYNFLFPCDDYLRNFMHQITIPVSRIGIWVLEQDYNVLTFITKTTISESPSITYRRIVPAFCTASGKVLLASLPKEELNRALAAQDIRPYTASTITDISLICKQLEVIRDQGYAIDVEEYANFEVNVAAPIKNHTGKTVATIVVTASKMLYQNRSQDYIQMAVGLAHEMSSLLGYRGEMS